MVFSQNVSCIFEGFTYPKCKLHLGEVPPAKTVRIFLPQFFCDFFQNVSSFGGPQFGSGTFPFGWPPVHLAGVSLNIARSSASQVHLGPPFSSLMFPLSSAQVFLPCPG